MVSLFSLEFGGLRKAIGALGGFQAEKNADGLTARPLGDGYATPHKMWHSDSSEIVAFRWVFLGEFGWRGPISAGFQASERSFMARVDVRYDRDMVLSAWERLLAAASEGEVSSTMNYDLVNVGREVLSKLSNGRYEALLNASTASEVAKRGEEMLELMLDAERASVPCFEMERAQNDRNHGITIEDHGKTPCETAVFTTSRRSPVLRLGLPDSQLAEGGRELGLCGAGALLRPGRAQPDDHLDAAGEGLAVHHGALRLRQPAVGGTGAEREAIGMAMRRWAACTACGTNATSSRL